MRTHFIRLGLLASLGLGILSCNAEIENPPGAVPTLSLALTGASGHDLSGVRFDIVAAEDTCDGAVIATETVGVPSDAGSFFIPPGSYRACATPLGADGMPSAICGRSDALVS